ncbi:MAG TPA: DegV family protein [Bacillota bacterium]|nr:DegV family protein [Bacillota bacterium]
MKSFNHGKRMSNMSISEQRVKIITDSAGDIPAELVRKLGITVLPMMVCFGEEEFRDGVDLSSKDFFARLRNDEILPKTAQPLLSEVKKVLEATAAEGVPAVVIHMSSGLSGTYSTTRMVAEEINASGAEIRVIDSLSASFGEGMLVLEAAEMARDGATAEAIEREILRRIPRMNHLFILDTMEYLLKGGRISRTQAIMGTVLDIKPTLFINNAGLILPRSKARGRRRSIEQLLAEVENRMVDPTEQKVGVIQADCPNDAEILAEEIQRRLNPKQITMVEMTATVGTHIGPGMMGVTFDSDKGRE